MNFGRDRERHRALPLGVHIDDDGLGAGGPHDGPEAVLVDLRHLPDRWDRRLHTAPHRPDPAPPCPDRPTTIFAPFNDGEEEREEQEEEAIEILPAPLDRSEGGLERESCGAIGADRREQNKSTTATAMTSGGKETKDSGGEFKGPRAIIYIRRGPLSF
ncbi:hypothetical protein NL676_030268 [Syzygium grande]|nr:hypothetical protein NL676_030268 [Syzygium grande]